MSAKHLEHEPAGNHLPFTAEKIFLKNGVDLTTLADIPTDFHKTLFGYDGILDSYGFATEMTSERYINISRTRAINSLVFDVFDKRDGRHHHDAIADFISQNSPELQSLIRQNILIRQILGTDEISPTRDILLDSMKGSNPVLIQFFSDLKAEGLEDEEILLFFQRDLTDHATVFFRALFGKAYLNSEVSKEGLSAFGEAGTRLFNNRGSLDSCRPEDKQDLQTLFDGALFILSDTVRKYLSENGVIFEPELGGDQTIYENFLRESDDARRKIEATITWNQHLYKALGFADLEAKIDQPPYMKDGGRKSARLGDLSIALDRLKGDRFGMTLMEAKEIYPALSEIAELETKAVMTPFYWTMTGGALPVLPEAIFIAFSRGEKLMMDYLNAYSNNPDLKLLIATLMTIGLPALGAGFGYLLGRRRVEQIRKMEDRIITTLPQDVQEIFKSSRRE